MMAELRGRSLPALCRAGPVALSISAWRTKWMPNSSPSIVIVPRYRASTFTPSGPRPRHAAIVGSPTVRVSKVAANLPVVPPPPYE
jgi:hypothetical protein